MTPFWSGRGSLVYGYNPDMRKPIFLMAASLLFALVVSMMPKNTQAQPAIQSGSDLLAAVNSLRASNGLPAYSANSILMQIAQAQADYLAATGGSAGHTGPGGSTPKDRALAAGYPAFLFSENWQSGNGLSPSGAVSIWQGDSAHLNTMLSASLVDAGAGVSKSGGTVYYVLDAGASGGSTGSSGTLPAGTLVAPGTPIISQYSVPVTLNTPDANGIIYHEVAYGQSLWSIAIAYGTKIEAIKQLNNLGNTEIYVGQKLIVLKGPTPVPATPTAVETQTPVPVTPTLTGLVATEIVTNTVSATAAPNAGPSKPSGLNLTAILIIVGALLFAALGTWAGTRKAV